jgi:hypothetical protein
MQNRQLPPCSKSRRHLYPTHYWNTAQALTNQWQQLKLEWSLVSARPTARGIKMRAPRHVGTIHGYAINKRTPALLATSQTGSTRNRQHQHHSPVAAALSTQVLLCCETTEPLPQGKTTAWLYRRMPSHASQPAVMQHAPPGVQPAARLYQKKKARLPFSEPQFLLTASQLAATQRAPLVYSPLLYRTKRTLDCPFQGHSFGRPATNRTWLSHY